MLSVASDDDRPPLTVPVWYAYDGAAITFFTGTQGRKARKSRLIDRTGTVSVCVQQPEFPYRYVTAECEVTREPSPTLDAITAVTSRYLPEDMARAFAEQETTEPTGTFALYRARPTRWLTQDFG